MGEENNHQGNWPTKWMDQLPSALFLMQGSRVVKMNGLARFLFGWNSDTDEKELDLFKGDWLLWREEDKVYFDMKWASIDEGQRRPVRMELEAKRNGGMAFQVELKLSSSPSKGLDLLQIVDISEQRFRQQALQDREAHYRRLNDIAQEAIVLVKEDIVLDVNSRFLVNRNQDRVPGQVQNPLHGAHRW